jgi:GH24 family phage-related lysozyme (muramidase)
LRTGRRVIDDPESVETKLNPWHDPDDGRFTFAGQGRYFGNGAPRAGEDGAGPGARGPMTARRATTKAGKARTAVHKPAPAAPKKAPAKQAGTPVMRAMGLPVDGGVRDRPPQTQQPAPPKLRSGQARPRQATAGRNAPAVPEELVQRFKRHMIPKEHDRNVVYLDSKGIPTVGIGHKVVPADKLKLGDRISDARKDAFWRQDSTKALAAALQQAEQAGIDDPEFLVALADVNFQLGSTWNLEHKKTWALIMNGDYQAAAREAQDSEWYRETPARVIAFQRALLALRPKPARKPTGQRS